MCKPVATAYRLVINNSGTEETSFLNLGVYAGRTFVKDNSLRNLLSDMLMEHNNDEDFHPPGHKDFYYIDKNDYFACKSLESLREWFGEWFDKLLRYEEVSIQTYDLKCYREGVSGKQITFRSEDASNYRILEK